MSLYEVKLNTTCKIEEVAVKDYKTKIRLMELGLVEGTKIYVKHKSVMKKTLLVVFDNSCFTLKENLAKEIAVKYA